MKYQICCDMDGVLCNFTDGAINIINDSFKNKENIKREDPELYRMILEAQKEAGGLVNSEEFWANLSWIEGGPEIWEKIKDHNPYILSAPMKKSEKCIAGKIKWVEKNLKPTPLWTEMIFDDNKGDHAQFQTKDGTKVGLLIDDLFFNIKNYRDNGGKAIWSKNWKRTLKILDYWMKKN